MTEELINKYRPTNFTGVIGQDSICKSIKLALKKKRGRSFLLSGPSGVGKTTIGRIIAKSVGCSPIDIIEVDGATTTGIDAMRELISHLAFKNIGGSPRAIIVDECHAISAQAFKSLLKILEEPPEGIYWILCTTEFSKVPQAVRTRCLDYKLKSVSKDNIRSLIVAIAKEEKLPIRKSKSSVQIIIDFAEGSPRQAISMLAQCGHLKEPEEVEALCTAEASSQEAIDLCRLLLKGANWKQLCSCINKINVSSESVRIIVLRYMSAVAIKGGKPQLTLAVMDEFSQPFLDREGKAPLLLACGRLCFSNNELDDEIPF